MLARVAGHRVTNEDLHRMIKAVTEEHALLQNLVKKRKLCGLVMPQDHLA